MNKDEFKGFLTEMFVARGNNPEMADKKVREPYEMKPRYETIFDDCDKDRDYSITFDGE